MMRMMSIWLPQWPLQRLYRDVVVPKHQVVIIHRADPHGKQYVAWCSKPAIKLGVYQNMALNDALTLPYVQARAALFPHDPGRDQQVLQRLAKRCERFSPCIGFDTDVEPSSLFLDISGAGPCFGGEHRLVRKVWQYFSRQGLAVRVAIADTLGAAWAFCRCKTQDREPFAIISPGKHRAQIDQLAPEYLRLDTPIIRDLYSLGIYHIEQLRTMTRAELISRWGYSIVHKLDQAYGDLPETITPIRHPQPLQISRAFENPIESMTLFHRITDTLLEEILNQCPPGHAVSHLRFLLTMEGNEPMRSTISLSKPTRSLKHLSELVQLRYQTIRFSQAISKITLKLYLVGSPDTTSSSLFQHQSEFSDDGHWSELVDRLRQRLGATNLVQPIPTFDPVPEESYVWNPLSIKTRRYSGITAINTNNTSHNDGLRIDRPVRLSRTPIPIEVLAVAPHGPPCHIRLGNQTVTLFSALGPERIASGWWRGNQQTRDYYSVMTNTGEKWWIYRLHDSAQWYLHGWFD